VWGRESRPEGLHIATASAVASQGTALLFATTLHYWKCRTFSQWRAQQLKPVAKPVKLGFIPQAVIQKSLGDN
jgi:hypothetical protein